MQFGVCTWIFNQPLAKTAATLKKLGFDGVELLGDLDQYSADEAKRILDDNGLAPFSLTPANVDIAHPDAVIRQPAIDYFFRLVDFAAELGQPMVSCHGLVGRIKAAGTQQEEDALLVDAVRQIAERAGQSGLKVVFEVLNRYETHQIHNHEQALTLLNEVGADNLGILLDAYHMNIEEGNPADALRRAGERLWLYHVADSNRAGIGHGHTDFPAQVQALLDIGYSGPAILECTTPGPNPFTPEKGPGWRDTLEGYLAESLSWLKARTGA